nr:gluconate 2-dehydrogenase subunit 3 family protein [Lysinibacillus timonensis]
MENDKKGVSRRDFMKTTGIATGTLIGGGIIGGLIGYNVNRGGTATDQTTGQQQGQGQGQQQDHPANVGLKFFTSLTQFNILAQATERIFPEDDLGPGAIGLGVPYFIDNQLAGAYGMNAKEYMQGPFADGASTQGYQSRLTRAEIFTQGIAKLEEEAVSRYEKGFAELEPDQMDEILTAFQKGEVPMLAVTSDFFFKLLRQATLEGAYADPIYNGNRNMDGWRMKGFPGHQYAYIGQIESEEFVQIDPQSISSMTH